MSGDTAEWDCAGHGQGEILRLRAEARSSVPSGREKILGEAWSRK